MALYLQLNLPLGKGLVISQFRQIKILKTKHMNPKANKNGKTRQKISATFSQQESQTSIQLSQLNVLKLMSKVVADTGEFELIKKYKPIDSTTNPSLLLKAVQQPEYSHFLKIAIDEEKEDPSPTIKDRPYAGIADRLAVLIGCEILKIVPGRVSTEVDAHLSYDTEASVSKALRLVELYENKGIDSSRLYIKMASTWEGAEACKILQGKNIDCNMTLLFSFAQAIACANANASLISPFVGRILDWHKKKEGRDFAPEEDPGVKSVQRIYNYYKAYGYATRVMAASFRNIGEIQQLAGCDNITIAPALLEELEKNINPLPQKLFPNIDACDDEEIKNMDEKLFKEMHDADEMAREKLIEGIENFTKDQEKLEDMIGKLA